MIVRLLVALSSLCLLSLPAAAVFSGDFTGFKGWVSLDNQAVPGVTVYAFREYDRGLSSDPVARSAPSPADGTFSLEVPAGSYHLVAARAGGGGLSALAAGDLFCYFGGNPVRVEHGRPSVLGLSLQRVGTDPDPSVPAGLAGTVYDERGKPLPGAVVFAYTGSADGFRGMPGHFSRTREDGTFHLRVRKGTFFVLARKRESGELFGPTLPGDYFGFYPRNPVSLAEGEGRGIRIDAQPRQVAREKLGDAYLPPPTIVLRAKAVDPAGNPVAGVRLLAYRSKGMSGFPAYVSAKSRADGLIDLEVAEEGTYFLLVREKLGGPADGEWYGKFSGSGDHSVGISRSGTGDRLTIVLEKR